jgi:drug/metabolite transporter (DMT)-like permease
VSLPIALLVLGQVLSLSAGQILWKVGVAQAGGFMSTDRSLTDTVLRLAQSPAFVAGTVLYATATLIYLFLLSRFELTYIYPILSLTFVSTVVLGWLVLGEPVSLQRVIAVGVITAGVALMAQTGTSAA